jgi:hypothetical protein
MNYRPNCKMAVVKTLIVILLIIVVILACMAILVHEVDDIDF